MAEVRAAVEETTGVSLTAETRLLGFPRRVLEAAGIGSEQPASDEDVSDAGAP
jgi:hypothetical protein